jgi:hypothetical protein
LAVSWRAKIENCFDIKDIVKYCLHFYRIASIFATSDAVINKYRSLQRGEFWYRLAPAGLFQQRARTWLAWQIVISPNYVQRGRKGVVAPAYSEGCAVNNL